jgi:hypothetical protein
MQVLQQNRHAGFKSYLILINNSRDRKFLFI